MEPTTPSNAIAKVTRDDIASFLAVQVEATLRADLERVLHDEEQASEQIQVEFERYYERVCGTIRARYDHDAHALAEGLLTLLGGIGEIEVSWDFEDRLGRLHREPSATSTNLRRFLEDWYWGHDRYPSAVVRLNLGILRPQGRAVWVTNLDYTYDKTHLEAPNEHERATVARHRHCLAVTSQLRAQLTPEACQARRENARAALTLNALREAGVTAVELSELVHIVAQPGEALAMLKPGAPS